MLDRSSELPDDNVTRALQTAVLCKKPATADGGDHEVKEKERLSDGQRFT